MAGSQDDDGHESLFRYQRYGNTWVLNPHNSVGRVLIVLIIVGAPIALFLMLR